MSHDRECSKAKNVDAKIISFDKALRSENSSVQLMVLSFIFTEGCDILHEFEGDFQLFLIICAIGLAKLRTIENTAGRARGDPKAHSECLTASEISIASGIPRETVRRKLADLSGRGWIVSDEAGGWRLVEADDAGSKRAGNPQETRARRELRSLEDRTIKRVAELLAVLSLPNADAGAAKGLLSAAFLSLG